MSCIRSFAVVIGTIAAAVSVSASAQDQDYMAGASRVDITPDGPIWLSGYENRNKPSEGVEQRLFAKALVISIKSSGWVASVWSHTN